MLSSLTKHVPLLRTLQHYRREWLSRDLIAGLSVTAVQVPTAIAYAAFAGFPPEVGLYASMLPVLVYALFGSSRQLVIGPDAAAAVYAQVRSADGSGQENWQGKYSFRCMRPSMPSCSVTANLPRNLQMMGTMKWN